MDRSRLVAMTFGFAGASLSREGVRLLLSPAATGTDFSTCLAHIDVSKAYFYAPSCGPTCIMIPGEDMSEGDQKTLREELVNMGFLRGRANPCAC